MAPWTSPPSATFWGGGSLAKRHLSLRCNWCCPWGCLEAFLSLCMDIWSSWAGLPGDGAGKLWELQQNLGTQKRSQTLLERPKKWFIFAKPSQNDLQQNSGTNSEWLVGWLILWDCHWLILPDGRKISAIPLWQLIEMMISGPKWNCKGSVPHAEQWLSHPGKLSWNPKMEVWKDDFPFHMGDFYVPC